jgi:hypothetical protein
MRPIKSEERRSWLWALLPLTLLAAPATGCIVVEEDNCVEGELICTNDYVEECIDDDWVVIEDCVSLCGGECVYINDADYVADDTACLCP